MSSGYDTEKGRPARSSSRAIVFAVLGAAVIIGIGLAIGLGVGLRSRDDKTCETPITSEQSQTFKSGHGEYRFASVAADSALCSKIGTFFISVKLWAAKGGNAADAAIAAAICAGLMSAHSSGIGGGVFIVFYNRTSGQAITINARETAPAAASQDMFVNNPSLSTYDGTITREDLADYTVDVTSPVTFNVTSSGLTVYSMPLPGSGVVLGYIFNILSGYGFTPDSMSTTDKAVLTYHRIVEAMKFAYAKRSELGDPKFLNISQLVHNMTSPEVGQEIRAKISDDKTHDIPYYEPSFFNKNDKGTSHTSVFDGEGNAVAITSTVNLYFGSKMKGNRTGIIFNNEMDDFSTPNTTNAFDVPASPANFIQPGKRPLSSMTPSVFVDSKTGEVKLVAGASGGTKITTATALVAMRTLWFNDSLVEAVDDPRVHHQLFPPEIHVDPGFPKDIQDGLVAKGHKVVAQSGSVVQAILNEDERLYAVSDWRKGGAPDGY
ncbi:hypothetical protein C0Q70_08215 [Pomacea canaliculata]|uniref:Gamma-glutamyltransferase n=1 Tax=Pomacea canaliculata TaxID=400727 RepID=A0A2T7PH69_POMCA|nr:hypothetical protein C0Q70_08215 [Pomacea canaliculata]